jgi:hypothetical protein
MLVVATGSKLENSGEAGPPVNASDTVGNTVSKRKMANKKIAECFLILTDLLVDTIMSKMV